MFKSTSIPRRFGFRWVICALLFGATAINYMDRQILGLLAPDLQREIGWTEVQYAHVVLAFQVAYVLGLLLFGRIIDKVGTRFGYALSTAAWSIAAAAHALAHSVFGFGVARFALGIGEAGNYPAAVKAVAEWFPRKERALANGFFNSGANVGAVLAPILVPWITHKWGWRMAFVALGVLGFAWVLAWVQLSSKPEDSKYLSAAELEIIRGDGDLPELPAGKLTWIGLLIYRQSWAFIVGYALTSPIWWFYLYWLPKFLNNRFGVDLLSLGLPLVVIYSAASLGSVSGGWFSSRLLKSGWSVNAARKTAMLVCALCVLPVMLAAKTSNLWLAVGVIALAAAAHQGWAANLFALASDLFPKQAVASLVGLGALFGALMAMAFSEFSGFILESTRSYWILFLIAGCAYMAALIIIQALVPRLSPAQLQPLS